MGGEDAQGDMGSGDPTRMTLDFVDQILGEADGRSFLPGGEQGLNPQRRHGLGFVLVRFESAEYLERLATTADFDQGLRMADAAD